MNNKMLITLVAVLAAALIFETAYLLGSRERMSSRTGTVIPKQAPVQRNLPHRNIPIYRLGAFDGMSNWDPFVEMEKMQEQMHRLFDDSFSRGLVDKTIFRANAAFEPNISINQKDNLYIVKADLPGMDKSAINIEIKGRELILSGERKEEESKQDKGFYRQELNYGSFVRSILLPEDAKTDQIASEYKNGVLTITIPMEQSVKPAAPAIKVPVQ